MKNAVLRTLPKDYQRKAEKFSLKVRKCQKYKKLCEKKFFPPDVPMDTFTANLTRLFRRVLARGPKFFFSMFKNDRKHGLRKQNLAKSSYRSYGHVKSSFDRPADKNWPRAWKISLKIQKSEKGIFQTVWKFLQEKFCQQPV